VVKKNLWAIVTNIHTQILYYYVYTHTLCTDGFELIISGTYEYTRYCCLFFIYLPKYVHPYIGYTIIMLRYVPTYNWMKEKSWKVRKIFYIHMRIVFLWQRGAHYNFMCVISVPPYYIFPLKQKRPQPLRQSLLKLTSYTRIILLTYPLAFIIRCLDCKL